MALLRSIVGVAALGNAACFVGGFDAAGHPCAVDADCGADLVCAVDTQVCTPPGDDSSGSASVTTSEGMTSGETTPSTGETLTGSEASATGDGSSSGTTAVSSSDTDASSSSGSTSTAGSSSDASSGVAQESSSGEPCTIALSELTPTLGNTEQAVRVTLTGTALDQVDTWEVGGVAATLVQLASAQQAEIEIPAGTGLLGPATVAVSGGGCDAALDGAYRFVADVPSFDDLPPDMLTDLTADPSEAALALDDIDGDGALDVIVSTAVPASVSVWANDGSGGFGTAIVEVPFVGGTALATGELDGDGQRDVVVASTADLHMLLTSSGLDMPSEYSTNLDEVHGIAVFDLDGAVADDVVVRGGEFGAPVARTFFTTGNALMPIADGEIVQTDPTGTVEPAPGPIAVADLHGDGFLDVVFPIASDGRVAGLLGDGAGHLGTLGLTPLGFGTSVRGLAVARFSGAASFEALVVTEGGVGSSYHFGAVEDGVATFALQGVTRTLAGTAIGVASADFNLDGSPDVAIANGANAVEVLAYDGAPFSGVVTSIGGGTSQAAIAAGDVDGDQLPDLVLVRHTDPLEVVVLRNTSAD
ncbi:MAG: VCBS repeat-containing protein [Nannocystaceae bacterium]|nr:VCBS repeat-containing protein [Nannocystaceae bacterium]